MFDLATNLKEELPSILNLIFFSENTAVKNVQFLDFNEYSEISTGCYILLYIAKHSKPIFFQKTLPIGQNRAVFRL